MSSLHHLLTISHYAALGHHKMKMFGFWIILLENTVKSVLNLAIPFHGTFSIMFPPSPHFTDTAVLP